MPERDTGAIRSVQRKRFDQSWGCLTVFTNSPKGHSWDVLGPFGETSRCAFGLYLSRWLVQRLESISAVAACQSFRIDLLPALRGVS